MIKELQKPNTWSLDDAREDFMFDVYNTLDFLPTNNEANRIIDSFDSVTSNIKQEPCEDAISRREAIKMFTYNCKGEHIPDYDCDNFPVQIDIKTVKEMLIELPSIIPQPKTGYWIRGKYTEDNIRYNDSSYKCNECGRVVDFEENFCPDCGLRMQDLRAESEE